MAYLRQLFQAYRASKGIDKDDTLSLTNRIFSTRA